MINSELTVLMLNIKASCFALIGVVLAFFAPIAGLVLTVGLLIFSDTILGMYRAHKLGEKITSRKMSRLVSKLVLYEASILLVFCVDYFLLGELVKMLTSVPNFVTKLAAIGLAGIELKSINESLQMLGINVWASIKGILARTKEIKGAIEDVTGDTKTKDTIGNGDEVNI
jgi:hypothetical protein